MVDLRINISGNRIEHEGRVFLGTRRWEALTLACLADAGMFGLSVAGLQVALQRAGQNTHLDRTGLLRLFRGIESMLDAALGPGAFTLRVRFAPRQRTVGPWRFVHQTGEAWQVVGDTRGTGSLPIPMAELGQGAIGRAARHANAQPQIVGDSEPFSLFRVLELVFQADALGASGRLREASDLLLAASAAPNLTGEGQGLVDLRRARLLKRGGRFDEALDLATRVARRAGQRIFPDPGQKCLAMQLARRIRYDRAPHDHESLGADPYWLAPSPLPDARGLGGNENLAALIARRRSQAAGQTGNVIEARRLLQLAWQHLGAAIYWTTSARRYEDAENFVFNMGRVQASLHKLGDSGAVAASVRAYQIGLQIRDNFFVGKDSVWGHICIGNLWLEHPERRRELEAALGMERFAPSAAAFYLDACEQGKRIGDPRQLALCYLNLWRFGTDGSHETGPLVAIQRMGREKLLDLLRGRRDLKELLMRDAPDAIAKMLAR